MVRMEGLEPPRISPLAPKANVSANSTTSAYFANTGARKRNRTFNLVLKRDLLCRLSYAGIIYIKNYTIMKDYINIKY